MNTSVVGSSVEPASVGSVRFDSQALSKMKVSSRAGRGALVSSEQRSILPRRLAVSISRVGDAGWEPLVQGSDPSHDPPARSLTSA